MEEEKSIAKKMELIRQKNLAGVACWKLGLETPEVWEEVNAIGK
jgi:spore germination protein YaaH